MSPSRAVDYRDLILAAPYEICIERARYMTEAWQRHEHDHPSIRAARAFEHVVRRVTIHIHPLERLAGVQTSKRVGTPLPIERGEANAILKYELDALLQRPQQPYRIDPDDRRELEEQILPWWEGRTVRDHRKRAWDDSGRHVAPSLSPAAMVGRVRSLDLGRIVRMARAPGSRVLDGLREMQEITYNNPALVTNVFDVQGHMVLGNRNVLPEGFAGLRHRAEDRLARCRDEHDEAGIAFCEGVIISCDAIQELAARYAALAREQADAAADPVRRDELLAMAVRCERVPFHPPRDFPEALQAMWFTELGAVLAYGMTGIFATGRADQWLWPYYEQDRAAGHLDEDDAVEWLSELLVKLGSNLLLLPTVGKATGSELGADSMAVTVGGLAPDGRDGTNELSYRFLDAVARVKALGNTFSIRTSELSPPEWLEATAAVFQRTSGPGLFNDEKVVESLVGCGYPLEHARDYAVIGCVEPTSDGNTFGCTSGNDISLVGALEMTLLRGRLRVIGKRVGPDTGDPRTFETFEQLMHAFEQQVRFLVDLVEAGVAQKDAIYAASFHNPYVSATLDGCIDSARDMTCGGARYDFASISARGLGTVTDSLAAIRATVYERRRFTMDELLSALASNFRGREPLRQYLLNRTPKYGADDENADAIATRVASFFCHEVASRTCARGGPYRPGFFSYGMHVLEGGLLGATPDGRRAGEPLSNSLSPVNGSETNGPTGVMRSVARIDASQASNGYALNIKLMPSLLATPAGRDTFTALLRGYFDLGGLEVQPNVVDDATLRDAQRHPERYRDLVVRVSGYSAFWVDLGPAIQADLLARTAHERW
jgi:pyruvate formate-lyase/glycerol dehydratase family glycyl radical enzyme